LLTEGDLAQQPARGSGGGAFASSKSADALIGCGQQLFHAQFAGGAANTAGLRQSQQPGAGLVNQPQMIITVEGEKRGMHDFEDARQQGRCLQRTYTLLLQSE